MTIVVHITHVSIVQLRSGVQIAGWKEYSFHPTWASRTSHTGAFAMVRNGSHPLTLKVPHGSKLTDDGLFLRTHFSPWGLDATSCYHLAEKGERLFGFVDASPAIERAEPPVVVDQVVGRVEEPTAPADPAERWGVAFSFSPGRFMSFLARGGRRVRSTIALDEIESWPDRSGPEDWIRASGLDPEHITVGLGMKAYAALIPADADELRYGIQFELTSKSPAGERQAERPARPATVQAAFAF
ncbi:hypothetical protein [Singulisphaera sp. PoT]|uniref:hypothetical protein n=1 Tax=Singulisphaera sp. PoT TaxID=3411797 RepID=UPI003BF542DB